MESPPSLLVLGIGNLLMGDEGVGVHAIRALQDAPLPPGVTILDGGTGGFHLLSCLSDYRCVILIDATMDGSEPGTVSIIKPRFLSDYPRSLGAHDVGLRDLIESAVLLGTLPVIHLITVSIGEIRSATTELTSTIRRATAECDCLGRVDSPPRGVFRGANDRRGTSTAVAKPGRELTDSPLPSDALDQNRFRCLTDRPRGTADVAWARRKAR